MNDSIIVTGGAGFIGANFVRAALTHTGGSVVVLDKLTYAGHRQNLEGLREERPAGAQSKGTLPITSWSTTCWPATGRAQW